MGNLPQDLRYGARMLLKNPGFTLIAVITLSLGIGANAAVFSVVYGVLLKPLPYKDAERIVVARVSPPDFRDLKEATQVFDRMAIWGRNRYNVTVNGETTQVLGATVSPEFLPMLAQPAVGRFWRPDEDMQDLVVISHDYWQSGFAGAVPGVYLRPLLDQQPHSFDISTRGRHHQRRLAVGAGQIRIGASCKQQPHSRDAVTQHGRQKKRRTSLRLLGVDVGALR